MSNDNQMKCPECCGTGINMLHAGDIPCPSCNGTGNKPEQVEDIIDFIEPEEYLKEDVIRQAFDGIYDKSDFDLLEEPEFEIQNSYEFFEEGYKSRDPQVSELEDRIESMERCMCCIYLNEESFKNKCESCASSEIPSPMLTENWQEKTNE